MPFAKSVRAIAGAVFILILTSQPALAQTSIGFENPGDTSSILEYRLPDWGYRTWDLGFDLGGGGAEGYAGDDFRSARNSFNTGLDTHFNLYRESERRTYRLFAFGYGNYRRSHESAADREASGHDLSGRLDLGAGWTRYLGDGPFFLRVSANTGQYYAESIEERRIADTTEEYSRYQRRHDYYGNLGGGVGRVRDVTPLIRAQRLSERLTALGRPPLSGAQVREIGRVLATEQGYRTVFDRPDKSFWRDVLEPMLDPAHPLSPYEIFYLKDVLEEDVGPRAEGTELRAWFVYEDEEGEVSDESSLRRIDRGPTVAFRWVRNLTFDQQLSILVGAGFLNSSRQESTGETVRADLDVAYLWTIADRYRWDTIFNLDYSDVEATDAGGEATRRDLDARLRSEFTVFLENSLSLSSWVTGTSLQTERSSEYVDLRESYFRNWQWTYGIGLRYYLDRVLY
jgi:hypothetical protein